VKVVGSGVFIDPGQFGGSTGGCSCNEQFDQFVLNGLTEATFSHRNILITFEYSWLSRTAPNILQFMQMMAAIPQTPSGRYTYLTDSAILKPVEWYLYESPPPMFEAYRDFLYR